MTATGKTALDQIERGLDGVTAGPERIWLQSYEDSTAVGEDRLWCEDKVWPNGPEDHEPTEYVRADLFRDLEERLAKAAEALEASADQLARAHDDAFKQCAGYGLVTSDGRDFSCLQLNKCGEQASRARTALSQIRSEK